MICITKFKDGTYVISNGHTLDGPLSYYSTIASAYWIYKLNKKDVIRALAKLNITSDDMAVFIGGLLFETRKLNEYKSL